MIHFRSNQLHLDITVIGYPDLNQNAQDTANDAEKKVKTLLKMVAKNFVKRKNYMLTW